MKSISLQNAQSLKEIVEIINEEIVDIGYNNNELAAQYAFSCAEDQEDTSEDNILAHLEILEEEGAKFDYYEVLKITENMKMENLKVNLKTQENEIREILEAELKSDRYHKIEDDSGNELSVYKIVFLQFFQENDLAQKFIDENDTLEESITVEELREFQHEAMINLSDIIDNNQKFRDELKKKD